MKQIFAETKGGHKSVVISEEELPHQTVMDTLSAIKQINNYSYFCALVTPFFVSVSNFGLFHYRYRRLGDCLSM